MEEIDAIQPEMLEICWVQFGGKIDSLTTKNGDYTEQSLSL